MLRGFYDCFAFALENKWLCHIKTGLSANMFHFIFVVLSQVIKPQAILILVNDPLQDRFYLPAFCCVHVALKDGILHTLSLIHI